MANDSSVVIFAAHGAVSGKGDLVSKASLGSYNILMPVKSGDQLCLTAHNMVVGTLIRASNFSNAGDVESLRQELFHIEDLPSTTSVAAKYTREIQHNQHDLGSFGGRKSLSSELETAKKTATDGKQAWELLEHRVCHAMELLDAPSALVPSKIWSTSYTQQILEAPNASKWSEKLVIHVNYSKLMQQVKVLKQDASVSRELITYSNVEDHFDTPIPAVSTKIAKDHVILYDVERSWSCEFF